MVELVTLDKIREGKYARIVCYPKYSFEEIERRLEEMRILGINAIESNGESTILGLPVLGKGYVGVVVLARTNSGKVALKIRRTDSDRAGMTHEAKMLQMANSVNVGPRLKGFSENFLLMEYVGGMLLPEWIKSVVGTGATTRVGKVLRDVTEQSWRLDKLGLDHGELSRASRHIIVNPEDKAYILDFETASINRRVSNVTCLCQYLFMRSEVAETVKKSLGEVKEADLIGALRIYKKDHSRKKFEEIVEVCNF